MIVSVLGTQSAGTITVLSALEEANWQCALEGPVKGTCPEFRGLGATPFLVERRNRMPCTGVSSLGDLKVAALYGTHAKALSPPVAGSRRRALALNVL